MAETVEDGWKYDLYAKGCNCVKTTSAGEVLDFMLHGVTQGNI